MCAILQLTVGERANTLKHPCNQLWAMRSPRLFWRIIQLPCSLLLLNSNPPKSDFHKKCACHAKLSCSNHPLIEGEIHGLRKNVQNFIKVHFRLLTANPKAEALYLITETAKKKENSIQNILRPCRYFLSFMRILTYLICPFKHKWGSSKIKKLKVNRGCNL